MFELILYKIKAYITLVTCAVLPTWACTASAEMPEKLHITMPIGFQISVIAKLDVLPRMLAFDHHGDLYVSSARSNQILMLSATNRHGGFATPVLVSDKLNAPNGLVFVGDDLFVANENGIVKLTRKNDAWSEPMPFISNLAIGHHTLKTIKIGADNHLYINVGSSCNVCVEEDATRAAILRYTLEGKPAGALQVFGRHTGLAPIWATGLRNAQGFAWHPQTGTMFATNNGADMRADSKNGKVNDELPPEHLNRIEPGHNYGWPYCWGSRFEDPNFPGPDNFCKNSTPPAITFTSHSTPIGITFLDKSHFPAEYKNDAIVALHGSWNREQLSGYKLVRVRFDGDNPVAVVDFATGWLNNNQAWGRPVDVIVGPDGALYVSDDRTGNIYRIIYKIPD